jgi:hypothetical protein
MTRQTDTGKKRVRDLSAKTVGRKQAKSVRGGALNAYLKLKGQKQGEVKK